MSRKFAEDLFGKSAVDKMIADGRLELTIEAPGNDGGRILKRGNEIRCILGRICCIVAVVVATVALVAFTSLDTIGIIAAVGRGDYPLAFGCLIVWLCACGAYAFMLSACTEWWDHAAQKPLGSSKATHDGD